MSYCREYNFRIVRSNNPTAMTETFLKDERFSHYKDGDKIEIMEGILILRKVMEEVG